MKMSILGIEYKNIRKISELKISFVDANGIPIKVTAIAGSTRETHEQALGTSGATNAQLTVSNGSTFTLQEGETIKITNLPDGATYIITETGQAGYKATIDYTTTIKGEDTPTQTQDDSFARGADAATSTLTITTTDGGE